MQLFLLRLSLLGQQIFLVLVFFDRALAQKVAAVHCEVSLRRSNHEPFVCLADDCTAAKPQRVGKANVVSIETAVRQRRIGIGDVLSAHAAGLRASIAEVDRDHVIRLTGQNPNWNLLRDRLVAMRQLDRIDIGFAPMLAFFIVRRQTAHLLRGARTDERNIVPSDLRQRLRQFL